VVADGEVLGRLEVFYDLAARGSPPARIKIKPTLAPWSSSAPERGRYVYRLLPPAASTARRRWTSP